MKKMLSFLLSLVLLAGCSSGSSEKTVKVSDVADLIAAQDTLVPGPDYSWGLDEETLLEQVHGADTMIPGSEQFDSLRYSYNGAFHAATYTPPVRYQLKGIKTDATCAYAFCGDGLYMSGYQWIFDGSEADAQEGIETILSQLNEISFLFPCFWGDAHRRDVPTERFLSVGAKGCAGTVGDPYRFQNPNEHQHPSYGQGL